MNNSFNIFNLKAETALYKGFKEYHHENKSKIYLIYPPCLLFEFSRRRHCDCSVATYSKRSVTLSQTLFSPPSQLTLSNSLDYISFELPHTLHWTHTAQTMNPDLLHKSPLQLGTIMNSNKADSDSLMQHTASPMTSPGNEDFKQDHTTRATAERPRAHSPPMGSI